MAVLPSSFAAHKERDESEDTGLPIPEGDEDRFDVLYARAAAATPVGADPLLAASSAAKPRPADRFPMPESLR